MTDTQKWQLLALICGLGVLVYWLAPVLTPFAIAALFAYLGDPLVDWLQRFKLGRSTAVALVFCLMATIVALVLIGLVPLIEHQVAKLFEKIPVVVRWFSDVVLPWIKQRTGLSIETVDPQQLIDAMRTHWQQAGGVASSILSSLSRSGLAVVGFVGTLALVPVVTFYLLRDWDDMVSHLRELLPRTIEPTVVKLAIEANQVLGAFLRGQVMVMLSLASIYSAGLLFIGLDLALLIGILAGAVSFVPYLGLIVGGAAAIIAAAVQYQDWIHPLLVVLVFVIGQLLEGFLLTPKLVGDRVGLHPVAVIFSVLAGGQLFGFLGVLLALPVTAVLMVLLRHANERYKSSNLYGVAPQNPPEPSHDSLASPSDTSTTALAPTNSDQSSKLSATPTTKMGA